MTKNRGLVLALWVALLLLASLVHAQLSAELSRGLGWLSAQVQPDGSIAGEANAQATSSQTQAEVVRTLATLSGAGNVPSGLRDKLAPSAASGAEPAEILARQVLALRALDADTSAHVTALAARQNVDGGFGMLAGDPSNSLDTSWAHAALAEAGASGSLSRSQPYLIAQIGSDGSMQAVSSAERIHRSALAVVALQNTGSDLAAVNASRKLAGWLVTQQKPNGSWMDSEYLTGVSLAALSTQGADPTARGNARAFLVSRQQTDGSWGHDPYLTALVLRAIAAEPQLNAVPGSISGTVVDAVSGAPLQGVSLSLSGAATATATTDASGAFSLAGLSSGDYTLAFSKSAYAGVSKTLNLGLGQSAQLGAVAMVQSPTIGVIKGRVSGADGQPIAGASVLLSGAVNAVSVTDVAGNYEFPNVPAGVLQLQVVKTGYVMVSAAATVVAGQTLIFAPTLYVEGATDVPTQGRLVGKVVAAGTQSPLAGVAVLIDGSLTATSNADGSFSLELAPATYRFDLSAAGYVGVTGNFVMTAGAVVDAGTIALTPVRSTTSVMGKVIDATTGSPLPGATVSVGGASARAGGDGTYRVDGLSGTTFDVRVNADGYLGSAWQLQLERPTDVYRDWALDRAPTGSIDLLALAATPQTMGAQTDVAVTGQLVNAGATAQSVVLKLYVHDTNGEVVGSAGAYTADGQQALGVIELAAGEARPVLFKWNSMQFAPGAYQLVATVGEAGSASTANPLGSVLVRRPVAVSLTATQSLLGAVSANPPVMQVTATTAAKLTAVLQNSGNTELPAQTYRLIAVDEAKGTQAYQAEVNQEAVAPNGLLLLTFPDWTPSSGGNYRLELTAVGHPEQGKAVGKLYVGDAATATYTVNKAVVGTGNQTVRGTVAVTGQDAATTTITDPLAGPIKVAIQKGVAYNDPLASSWTVSNRCLGCHVATQALVGGDMTRRLTTYNTTQRNTLFNALSNYRQSDGSLYASHPEYARTQTMLGFWALNSAASKDEIASTLVGTADYVVARQDGAGAWSADHPSGWWAAKVSNTAFNLKSLVETMDTLKRVPNPVRYNNQTWISGNGLNGTYYLAPSSTGRLLLANYVGGTLMSLGQDGSVQTLASGLQYPQGMVEAPDGSIFVNTQNSVMRRAPDGRVTSFAALGGAHALVLASNGDLLVSKYGDDAIYRIDSAGVVSLYFKGAPLAGPIGMAYDRDGALIVVNYRGQSVVRIKPDKTYETLFSWTNGNPRSVIAQGDGWLVGTNTGVYRFNAQWRGERLSFSSAEALGLLADGGIITGAGNTELRKLSPVLIDVPARTAAYTTSVTRAMNWLLNDANLNSNSNLEVAHRLIGLGTARRFFDGTSQAATLQTKMEALGAVLRSRQRADGGWGRDIWAGSDSMVTAQVGFALDYLQPSPSDPVVQNAIRFLLARQQADGSWRSENGVLSTNLAATTWVAIWLPVALDRIGGIDTTLSLSFAPNVSASNPSLTPTSSVNNPDGSKTLKWSMVGVTSSSRVIQFDLGLSDMQIDEQRPVSTDARLVFRNSYTQEDVQSPIAIPKVAASAFMGLGVMTDKVAYPAAADVLISATVNNLGASALDGSVGFAITELDGRSVAVLGRQGFQSLAVGEGRAVSWTWNTGSTYAGPYLVVASLRDKNDQLVATATTGIVIQAGLNPSATVGAALRLDKGYYRPTDSVRVTDRVLNLAPNQNQQGLQVETEVFGAGDALLWNRSALLEDVPAGGYRELGYQVPLATYAPGRYSARLNVKDINGALLASDAKTFEVQSTAVSGSGLAGSIAAVPGSVEVGTSAVFNWSVLNAGNAGLTDVPLLVRVVDPSTGALVTEFTSSLTLSPGQQATQALSWVLPLNLANKTLVVGLFARFGDTVKLLAQNQFQAIPPRIVLDAGSTLGKESRVLALVACPVDEHGHGDSEARHGNQRDDDHGSNRDGEHHDKEQDDKRAGNCATQRGDALSAALTTLGLVHKVVYSPDEFEMELQCGIYNAYWISGGSEKLGDALLTQLREAVRRGDGLVVDGPHDNRNGELHQLLGVKHQGKMSMVNQTLTLPGTPLFPAGTLQTLGRPVTYTLTGGTANASFAGHSHGTWPGIVSRDFGQGHGVLFAFDLVRMLQDDGMSAAEQDMMQRGLAYLASGEAQPVNLGTPVAVRVTVRNSGVQTASVQVRTAMPAGASFLGGTDGVQADVQGGLTWNFELPAGAQKDLMLRLAFSQTGEQTLSFAVHGGASPASLMLLTTATQKVQVQTAEAVVQAATAAVQGLQPQRQGDMALKGKALQAISRAGQKMQAQKYARALESWMEASELVVRIAGISTDAALYALAQGIQAAQRALCPQRSCLKGDLHVDPDGSGAKSMDYHVRNTGHEHLKAGVEVRVINTSRGNRLEKRWSDDVELAPEQSHSKRVELEAWGEPGDVLRVELWCHAHETATLLGTQVHTRQ